MAKTVWDHQTVTQNLEDNWGADHSFGPSTETRSMARDEVSLGGEAIVGQLSDRERDLLDEAWVWRAIQLFARNGGVKVELGRDYEPIISTSAKVYALPKDQKKFLADARKLPST